MHALIIEDQFLIATLIEEELRDLGYNSIEIVDREAQAVEAALRRSPDLITADDRLVEGTGIGAVRAICASRPAPFVFLVGNPHEVEPLVGKAVLVGKPFGGERLRQAVAEAIERHRQAAPEFALSG